VVHLEGLLVAVDGELPFAHDAAGIVREHVDARVALPQLGGEGSHLAEVCEVGRVAVDVELGCYRLRLLG
jgi:hypothetical protein